MRILLCICGGTVSVTTRFETMMASVAGKRISGVCRNVETLERELRKPWGLYDLVILFAETGDDMERLVSLRELLEGMPVVVVMLEERPELLKAAHRLHPRFVSVGDEGFSDVYAVLEKMIAKREAAAV